MNSDLASGPPLVEFDDIVVEFGQNRALDGISLKFSAGEIVGLVGSNGAGKSTLGRVLVGEIPHDGYRGSLRVAGQECKFTSARAAHEAGVVLVHQEGAAIGQLSVGENVMLTIEPSKYGWIDWDALNAQAAATLHRLGVVADTTRPLAQQGGVALMGLTEIARSIARGSKVFVFDESTAALGAEEIRTLLQKLRQLSAEGAVIIFISHRIDEVLSICDRVVVLRDGRIVMDEPRDELDHAKIVTGMLGPNLAAYERSSHKNHELAGSAQRQEASALSVSNWTIRAPSEGGIGIGPIDFELRQGKVLGVFGPLGAGKTELLRSLFGLMAGSVSGEIRVGGISIAPFGNPRAAIMGGLALVSADRQKEGVVPQLSIIENMMLGYHNQALKRHGRFVRHETIRTLCDKMIRDLGIRAETPDQPVGSLSGGNQQKVLLARALLNSPSVLLLDEPTRGIDIGAKEDVYRWVKDMTSRGTSVIVSSMEESEILELADEIIVLRDGIQIATIEKSDADEKKLMTLAAGGSLQ